MSRAPSRPTAGSKPGVTANPWADLKDFTAARIALGRAGVSLPTDQMLAFQLDHARATDAVHTALDVDALQHALQQPGIEAFDSPLLLHSQAANRATYLQRPDLGRRLSAASVDKLKAALAKQAGTAQVEQPFDLALVVADGLSSVAVQQHAAGFLSRLYQELHTDRQHHWQLAPLSIVLQGRVAIGDEIASVLNARAVLMLIGERPGLSSPDSLGLYLTWAPKVGTTDASRNCISNVRAAGLSIEEAARKTRYLLGEARQRQLTGVGLKDRSQDPTLPTTAGKTNFLLE